MMDGQVVAIRSALDDKGYDQVGILAYAAKLHRRYTGRSVMRWS